MTAKKVAVEVVMALDYLCLAGPGPTILKLSMSGWTWADNPKIPELPDNQDGRIEFEIECDEDGEIVGITTLHRGLSARAEQLLKDEIRRNSLMKTSAGQAPARSKGRVVFILNRSKGRVVFILKTK